MGSYRWLLIGPDDNFRGVEVAECSTDAVAMMRAEQLLSHRRDLGGVEVWAGGMEVWPMEEKRLVGRVAAGIALLRSVLPQ